jgi:transposase
MAQEVEAHRAQNHPLIEVMREGEQGTPICMAQEDETTLEMSVLLREQPIQWQERRVQVQSMAAQTAARTPLLEQLEKAEQVLWELAVRTQGKPRVTSRVQGDERVASLLSSFRVQGLLQVQIQEEVHEQPVRAYRGTLSSPYTIWNFQVRVERMPEAIKTVISVLGWRLYTTNELAASLGLAQAVEADRDAYLVERTFSRLKGYPLSLGPLSVQRNDHRVCLVRLLTIALRVLTGLEGVVRQHVAQHQHTLAGQCASNPKRSTTQPPAERLLEAFGEITLTIVSAPGLLTRHVTPLSSLHQQIVPLCGFSSAVSVRLADDS